MKLKLDQPKNKNYCAIVAKLGHTYPLEKCDNVAGAKIFNNQVIVAKDADPNELGLFFAAESALDPALLKENNLYRDNTQNKDTTKKGYFEEHGRIKTLKFRGHKSEGLWLPLSCLSFTGVDTKLFKEGAEFDAFEYNGTMHNVCGKYVARCNPASSHIRRATASDYRNRVKIADQLVRGQFKFHDSTAQLRRNMHRINPDTIISISDKWHGTSVVVGNLLVHRELNWFERLLDRWGISLNKERYAKVYSSRTVVKGIEAEKLTGPNDHYKSDVWGEVFKEVAGKLPKGYTIYGEIVGYTPSGSPIQRFGDRVFSYGCDLGIHKLLVYRVTVVNEDGVMIELGWEQLKQFCHNIGVEHVVEFFHGRASDLCPRLSGETEDEWRDAFLQTVEDKFVNGRVCAHNKGLPAEGVVIRVDGLDNCSAFKAKSFEFLERETKALDVGDFDTEAAQEAA